MLTVTTSTAATTTTTKTIVMFKQDDQQKKGKSTVETQKKIFVKITFKNTQKTMKCHYELE